MFNTNANIFPFEQPPPNNYVFEMRNFKKQIEQQQQQKTPRGNRHSLPFKQFLPENI